MRLSSFVPAVMLAAALTAGATPVVYTLSGNFTGTLGSTSFINDPGTFSFTGDTSTATSGGLFHYNTVGTGTFSLAGDGTATFLSSTFGAESQANAGGFYDSATDFGLGAQSGAFAGYDLTGPIGPITGPFIFNGAYPELTSRGDLTITGETGNTTFTATTPAPEPSSIALLGSGLLGFAASLRRRFKQ